MKKKIVFAIAIIAALSTLVGCGNNDYVTLGDYSAITIEIAPKTEVTDADVEAKYQEVLNTNMSYETITDRPAEEGDLVEIDYIGSVDGEEFESGTIGVDGEDFLLGSSMMIPGFEEEIVGMSIGDNKIVDITFPDEYTEELAGKEAQFDITLNAIKVVVYPEVLTEEMITAANPDCTSEEELRAAFRTALEEASDAAYLQAKKTAILNLLFDTSTYEEELPEEMLTEYEEQLVAQTEQWAAAYGVDLDTFISSYFQMTTEEFDEEMSLQAIENAKYEILMKALIAEEKVEATNKEIDTFAEENFAIYEYESADAFVEAIGEDKIALSIASDRVFDILLANTTTNDLVIEE